MTGGDGLVRWRPDHRCYSISIWLAEAVAKYMKLSNDNRYKTSYKRSVSSLRPLKSCCLGNHKCHFEEEIPSVRISGKITYPLGISIRLMHLLFTHLWKFIRIYFVWKVSPLIDLKWHYYLTHHIVSYRGWIQISISSPSWLRICRLSNLGKGNLPCRLGSRPSSWVWLSTCLLHACHLSFWWQLLCFLLPAIGGICLSFSSGKAPAIGELCFMLQVAQLTLEKTNWRAL